MHKEVNFDISNVKPFLDYFEGDDESVKKLLLQYSGILYECRVCKNMFRSLINLAAHKRHYCKEHKCESMLAFNHEIPGDLEEESPLEPSNINEEITPNKIKTKIKKKNSFNKKKKLKVLKNISKCIDTDIILKSTDETKLNPAYETSDSSSVEELSLSSGDSKTNIEENLNPNLNQAEQYEYEPNNECSEYFDIELKSHATVIDLISCENTEKTLEVETQKEVDTSNFDDKSHEDFQVEKQIELLSFIKEEIIPEDEINNENIPETIPTFEEVQTSSDNLAKSNQTVKRCTTLSLSKVMMEKIFKSIEEAGAKSISNSIKDQKQSTTFSIVGPQLVAKLIKDHSLNIFKKKTIFLKNSFPTLKKKLSSNIFSTKNIPKDFSNKLLVKDGIQSNGKPYIIVVSKPRKSEISDSDETEYIAEPINVSSKESLETFPCPFCDTMFEEISIFTKHLEAMHGKTKSEVGELKQSSKQKLMNNNRFEETEFIIPNENISQMDITNEETLKETVESNMNESEQENNNTKSNLFAFNSSLNMNSRPKRIINKKEDKDFVNSQTMKWNYSKTKIPTTCTTSLQENLPEIQTMEKQILDNIKTETLECLLCHKSFNTFSNLRRHVALHFGWNRFGCKNCKFKNYNKSECKAHVLRVHKEIEDADSLIEELEYAGRMKRKMKCLEDDLDSETLKFAKKNEDLDLSTD